MNIEEFGILSVCQHFEQVRRISQDVMEQVEDFSNENQFENLNFDAFWGECKADFREELAATTAQLQSPL